MALDAPLWAVCAKYARPRALRGPAQDNLGDVAPPPSPLGIDKGEAAWRRAGVQFTRGDIPFWFTPALLQADSGGGALPWLTRPIT